MSDLSLFRRRNPEVVRRRARPITPCTIFAYGFGNRPRKLSGANHRGGGYLRNIRSTFPRTQRPPADRIDHPLPCVAARPAAAMTTTTDLPDLDSPRNGTAFVVRPDRHVPSRRHDARADDMDATLDLPLHPHASSEANPSGASSEANPSGYRMRVDVGYVTRYPNRCHTMPRISDAMRRASRRFVRLSIDAIRDAVTI
ncbi:hypothetical protein OWT26_32610 [Burkholderia sp. 1A5]